jgi:hypothetical protein
LPTGTWKRIEGQTGTCLWCGDPFDKKIDRHKFCRKSHAVMHCQRGRITRLVENAMRELAGKLVPSPASRSEGVR